MHLNAFFWEGVRRFHLSLKGANGTKKAKNPCFKSTTVFFFTSYTGYSTVKARYSAMLLAIYQSRRWLQSLRSKQNCTSLLRSCKTLVLAQGEGHFNVMDWPYCTCVF